jgi:hypothetical protein
MAETIKKSFKIYITKESDAAFSQIIEGQCDRFDDNINRYGKVFTLSSVYGTDASDLRSAINSILAVSDSIVTKVEVSDLATATLLYTVQLNVKDVNYSIIDPSYQPLGVAETLRFNMK